MVKPEVTGNRDLTYSRWHRTIGDAFYMIDLDCVEWRGERGVVALIEITRFIPNDGVEICDVLTRKETEIKILDELQRKTRAPAYLVLYTPTLSTFWIFQIKDGKPKFWRAKDNEGYKTFLQNL